MIMGYCLHVNHVTVPKFTSTEPMDLWTYGHQIVSNVAYYVKITRTQIFRERIDYLERQEQSLQRRDYDGYINALTEPASGYQILCARYI